MFQMRALFAEYERAQIAERQRISYHFRKLKGLFPGGAIPAGFRSVGEEGHRRLEVHPTWGPVVATCWTMVESGCSMRECATYLQEQGVPCRNKGRWSSSTISGMLAADWPLNGLVTKEQHERVKALLSLRKCPQRLRKHGPRKIEERPTPSGKTERTWLLQGLSRCAHCGAALVGTHGNGRGGRYHYLQCSGRAHLATGSGACTAIRLPADAWEQGTIEALKYLALDRQQVIEAFARETADWSQQVEPLKERQRTLIAERDEASRSVNRLIALALGNDTVQRAIADQLTWWQLRLEEAISALATVDLQLRSSVGAMVNGEALYERIREGVGELADASQEEQKAILANLLEWVRMGKNDDGPLPLELGLRVPIPELPSPGAPPDTSNDCGMGRMGPGAPDSGGVYPPATRQVNTNTGPLGCTRGSDTHTIWRRRADSNRRNGFWPFDSLAMSWIKPLSHVSTQGSVACMNRHREVNWRPAAR